MPEEFVYWKADNDGLWYFHLKGPDNEIFAQSKGYETMQNCLDAIESVKRYAPNAQPCQKSQEY